MTTFLTVLQDYRVGCYDVPQHPLTLVPEVNLSHTILVTYRQQYKETVPDGGRHTAGLSVHQYSYSYVYVCTYCVSYSIEQSLRILLNWELGLGRPQGVAVGRF